MLASAAQRRLCAAILHSRPLPCWHTASFRSCAATGTGTLQCSAAGHASLAGAPVAAAASTPGDAATLSNLQLVEQSMGPLDTRPMVPAPRPHVIVISGPSGVGKDAVLKRLQQLRPELHFVVTATSRAMRPGEVEGKDYLFVSKQRFEEWMEQGQLLEHALVYGEYKGIPRQQVDQALARGTDVVLRIDVQGAATVRKLLPDLTSIFLVAESEAALVARLVARKTEPKDKLLLRVQTAREETARIGEFDYVVVNREGQMDGCVAQIGAIIDAEKCRVRDREATFGSNGATC